MTQAPIASKQDGSLKKWVSFLVASNKSCRMGPEILICAEACNASIESNPSLALTSFNRLSS